MSKRYVFVCSYLRKPPESPSIVIPTQRAPCKWMSDQEMPRQNRRLGVSGVHEEKLGGLIDD